ncbi:hypothetical protein [Prosthecomicrobium hirschii]|uniref:hypothetical protein n=1 Tax=Prosthecodimorpha hirschii TaxID=665126 RepID=UPI00221E9310|nr:hypothetical protein [Prosthecomicrobium hirschii]MCW1838763.1 hypothetical protein [Prosthecomicrobium hirschii]
MQSQDAANVAVVSLLAWHAGEALQFVGPGKDVEREANQRLRPTLVAVFDENERRHAAGKTGWCLGPLATTWSLSERQLFATDPATALLAMADHRRELGIRRAKVIQCGVSA